MQTNPESFIGMRFLSPRFKVAGEVLGVNPRGFDVMIFDVAGDQLVASAPMHFPPEALYACQPYQKQHVIEWAAEALAVLQMPLH